MDLRFTVREEAFRHEVRAWLEAQLSGPFAHLRGAGGPGHEHQHIDARRQWERALADSGWKCIGWPTQYGGRDASLIEQVIFFEEYARARAPGRVGHIGEELIGPTIVALGTDAQKRRFLPPIIRSDELWCQGYSEPNAGSDLANVQTRAVRDGDEWVITGQKIWTSLAEWADWCFVLCRTNLEAPKHKGLSYLLVPMRQAGIVTKPIVQLTGGSEFSEVFFDGARTSADNMIGDVDGGWKVAMATLAFERGASTLAQQLAFDNELLEVIAAAQQTGLVQDPLIRDRLTKAWVELKIMRLNSFRMIRSMQGGALAREAMITKLYWANWHKALGELAMEVLGSEAEVTTAAPYELNALQRLFLFSRADTIYAGSNEIQKNLIGERALGLPPEPRVAEIKASTREGAPR
ncbi:MAG: acyl-CoA dehydrogenase family protein [Polyangiales bacterium]